MLHNDYIDYLNRIFAQWPDMRRYLNTARLTTEPIEVRGVVVQHPCITVTLFDKSTAPPERHDELGEKL